MNTPVRIRVAVVYPAESGRTLDQERVKAIASSIQDIGLRTPITVRPTTKVADGREIDAFEIVAGRHRYEAVCRLGWEEIDAVVSDDDDLHAELWEIDENLMRAELTPADRASCTARRKAIYEELHPEAKAHVAGAHASNRAQGNASANFAPAFTADTAAKTGKSERSVQLDASRGEKIAPDVLKEIKGTRWDKGVVLDLLKKLTHAEQRQALFRVKHGSSPDFEDAYDFIKGEPPAQKHTAAPARVADDPLNDLEAQEKQVARLMSAWNSASREAREEFLLRIDRPVFDSTRAA